MKKVLLFLVILSLVVGCKKEKSSSTPPIVQSCSPIPALDGLWYSDSVRYIIRDNNGGVLYDDTYITTRPLDHYRWNFLCPNGKPFLVWNMFTGDSLAVLGDSLYYAVNGTTLYDPLTASDTLDKKYVINSVSATALTLVHFYNGSQWPLKINDQYFFMSR